MEPELTYTNYISRTLSGYDNHGNRRTITEVELCSEALPLVILGEPGMGKTELLKKLSPRIEGAKYTRATALVRNPKRLEGAEGPLVIDALDEVAAFQEGDPLHNVLTALAKIGCPDFIISCRSADWRSVSARIDISDDYGREPNRWTLQPISLEQATKFLTQRGLSNDAAYSLLQKLDEQNLSDLYGNPLTLDMLSKLTDLACSPSAITRVQLFAKAVDVLRLESNNRHQKSKLSGLTKDESLDGAGALFASLLISGKGFIATTQHAVDEDDRVLVSEVSGLPGGHTANDIYKSRLFKADDASDKLLPVHRTIAEFLGARWLAKQIEHNHRVASRVFSLISVEGRVPASLRGLHAWLAQSPELAAHVIKNDPYGLLRYGDPNTLSVDDSLLLLDALEDLGDFDPYFRAEDWTSYTALALASSQRLETRLKEIIGSERTGFHLRTLLLEIMHGTPLVKKLMDQVVPIVTNENRYYAERSDAADALLSDPSLSLDWDKLIEELRTAGTEDSTRLAISLVSTIGPENFSPDFIALCVLTDVGLDPDQKSNKDKTYTGTLSELTRILPSSYIPTILDNIVDQTIENDDGQTANRDNWDSWHELSAFVHKLVRRYISEPDANAASVWAWLFFFAKKGAYQDDERELTKIFQDNEFLRRSIQKHALESPTVEKKGSLFTYWLSTASPGLHPTIEDVAFLLNDLGLRGLKTENDRHAFRSLVRQAFQEGEIIEPIKSLATQVANGDRELLEFLSPTLSQDEKERSEAVQKFEAERQKRKEEKQARWAKDRSEFLANLDKVKSGEPAWIINLAKAYLGLFSDLGSETEPKERIGEWLGDDITDAALTGFEATLHRRDLPRSLDIAKLYARGKYYQIIHPIIAGLAERWRTGIGFVDLPFDVVTAGWFGLMGEMIEHRARSEGLKDAIQDYIATNPEKFETALRDWFESYFEIRNGHIIGLYAFVHDVRFADLSVKLAADWLQKFATLSLESETDLVHCLIHAPQGHNGPYWTILKKLAKQRLNVSETEVERKRLWQAVDFLVSLDDESDFVVANNTPEPELLWYIRSLVSFDRLEPSKPFQLSTSQLYWIIKKFRVIWPHTERPPGMTTGDINPWDASRFIEWLIRSLSSRTSDDAVERLFELSKTEDEYTTLIRAAAADQRRAIIENDFQSPTLVELRSALEDQPPKSAAELKAVVLSSLENLQRSLKGNATNTVRHFYTDAGMPRIENDCRDLLVDVLELPFEIQKIPEEAMPAGKRADVGFRLSRIRVPMETKGQWNRRVWDAASLQLDTLYAVDHQAYGCGIYVVFWFGRKAPPGRRLKRPPEQYQSPKSPEEMQLILEDLVPEGRRDAISVFVLDLEI